MKKLLLLLVTFSCMALADKAPLFTVSVSGSSLSITTNTVSHTYPYAGIKINSSGFSLSGVGTECTLADSGYCTFSVSDTVPKTISVIGSGALSITLCLDGTAAYSCQIYKNLTLSSSVKTLYVANDSSPPAVSLCTLDPNGEIISCQDAGSDATFTSAAQGIVLNNSGTMAYITNGGNVGDIYQCRINGSTGLFDSCTTTPITSPSGYGPYYGLLTLNSANTLAYIIDNYSNNRILACPISGELISGTCQDTGALDVNYSSAGITINNAGDTLYFANFDSNNGVFVCATSGSVISTCIQKTGGGSISFEMPAGIALNKDESIIYVTDDRADKVYGCSTTPNNTSSFSNCFDTTVFIPGAWQIALNAAGTMAYVTDYDTNLNACPILQDGTFGSCTPTSSGLNTPVGVAVGN